MAEDNGNGQTDTGITAIFTKLYAWLTEPLNTGYSNPTNWFAAFVLIALVSFLWTKVLRQVLDV